MEINNMIDSRILGETEICPRIHDFRRINLIKKENNMKLLFHNYRIVSYIGGYKVSKRRGEQWSILSYHDTLSSAIQELFDLKVKTDTKDFVVDFANATKFDSQKNALVKCIEGFKEEVLEGLKK